MASPPTTTSHTPSTADTTAPINPARFAAALESLPIDAIHNKAAEIRNSIMRLRYSNEQMIPFADQGDDDCREAMFENLGVIRRMNERLGLLKAEVENRGLPWAGHEEDLQDVGKGAENGGGEMANGHAVSGEESHGLATTNGLVSGAQPAAPRAPSGRLTDEDLRRQLEAQMQNGDEDGEDGVHL